MRVIAAHTITTGGGKSFRPGEEFEFPDGAELQGLLRSGTVIDPNDAEGAGWTRTWLPPPASPRTDDRKETA